MQNLQEGQSVKGVVKNLTDYGAFVDLGGVDGLLHITDMAWKRIKHPSEIVEVGQELDVKILKFDREPMGGVRAQPVLQAWWQPSPRRLGRPRDHGEDPIGAGGRVRRRRQHIDAFELLERQCEHDAPSAQSLYANAAATLAPSPACAAQDSAVAPGR